MHRFSKAVRFILTKIEGVLFPSKSRIIDDRRVVAVAPARAIGHDFS